MCQTVAGYEVIVLKKTGMISVLVEPPIRDGRYQKTNYMIFNHMPDNCL
jgi:hypothetical protein